MSRISISLNGRIFSENDIFCDEGEEFFICRNEADSELYAVPVFRDPLFIFGEPEMIRRMSKVHLDHIEIIGNIETSIKKENRIMDTMTNIKEFSKELNNRGYHAKMMSVVKDGKNTLAIQVFNPSAVTNICPVVYLPMFETDSFNAKDVVSSILSEVKKNTEELSSYTSILQDWNLLKTKVRTCVRPRTGGSDQPTRPFFQLTRPFLDIELYIRAYLTEDSEGVHSVVLTHNLCKTLGISEDEVFHQAIKNTAKETTCMEMGAILPFVAPNCGMYIISAGRLNGAGAIATLSNAIPFSSGYIFPSSIHELIFVPDEYSKETTEGYKEMVKEVNSTAVDPSDFLSDSVYYYDCVEQRISLV